MSYEPYDELGRPNREYYTDLGERYAHSLAEEGQELDSLDMTDLEDIIERFEFDSEREARFFIRGYNDAIDDDEDYE